MNAVSRSLLICATTLTLLAACGRSGSGADGRTASVPLGTYRATLQLPGGELPFGLELAREAGGPVAYLINGTERQKVTEVTVQGAHLQIKMPGYENRLIADAHGGQLQGEVIIDKLGGKEQHIALHAALGQPYRFFAQAASGNAGNAEVTGRWAVTFLEDGSKPEMAVGEFAQSRDVVTGTFLTDTGDHRFLAGQVHDGELYLSTFDGAHAFLYKAKLDAAGGLSGDFWSGTAYHERWTAKKDPAAALPDAYSLTSMRSGSKTLDFSFPDVAGNTVTSNDPKFKNKVIVVALAGSWCPNCHDEAAFLSPLYRDYRDRGLEVVSLMFEHFGDFDRAKAATERFRQHYGIEYTTLIAGISDKDDAAKKLPSLERVYAFPTTIFIDRQGHVRKIHTGFSGPATGEHYAQFVDEFKSTIDQLLAESSPVGS